MKRVRIGFFGLRNSGKSSFVNKITNQDMSVVSDVKGTTTDPVKKSMEILPIGPVTIIDTPGFDDEGELGEKRIETTKRILRSCDIAILVTVSGRDFEPKEKEFIEIFEERKIPYLVVKNKIDLLDEEINEPKDIDKVKESDKLKDTNVEIRENINIKNNVAYVSSLKNIGIEEAKEKIANLIKDEPQENHLVSDFIEEKDIVVLVTPIDGSAPKGRLILPQQLAIRDILDANGIVVTVQPEELKETLDNLNRKPKLVITDSQVFHKVKEIVPDEILLTSFSILMARYKGFLEVAIKGAKKLESLKDGSNILISEGCTHHKQCEDIGTVKLPQWLKEYTKKELNFEWTNGNGFPNDLKKYDLVIHCGGCMLNENEVKYRMNLAISQDIDFTNYGIIIAYMQGILERSIKILEI